MPGLIDSVCYTGVERPQWSGGRQCEIRTTVEMESM
jgi:hypothetical protein